MRLSRKYNFSNGKKANAHEVNDEFNQILDLLNGKLESDNVKDAALTKQKMAFFVSENWRDPVVTFEELKNLAAKKHLGCYFVQNELAIYIYDETKAATNFGLTKIAGAVPTTSHRDLTDKIAADAHPMSAITGLSTKLTSLDNKQTLIVNDYDAFKLEFEAFKGEHTTGMQAIEDVETEVYNLRVEFDQLAEKVVEKGGVAPDNTEVLWLDESLVPAVLKRYNGYSWVAALDASGVMTGETTVEDRLDTIESSVSTLETNLDSAKFDKTGGTISGDVTVTGKHTFATGETTGLDISSPSYTGGKGGVLLNASDASDNFGVVIKSGPNKAGKEAKLMVNPVDDSVDFFNTSGGVTKVLHEGNTNNHITKTDLYSRSAAHAVVRATVGMPAGVDIKIPFIATVYDTLGEFNKSTYSFTPKEAGLYQVNWNVLLERGANSSRMYTSLNLNGTHVAAGTDMPQYSTTVSSFFSSGGSFTLRLLPGDVLSVYGYMSQAGNLQGGADKWAYFQITRIA